MATVLFSLFYFLLTTHQERMEKLQRNIGKEAARQKAAIEACQ